MNTCGFPVGVSALACAMAQQIENNADLVLLAALFTQLGDSLATIAAAREVCCPPGERQQIL